MKKIQLALLAMSLGFASNAWSANIDLEERIEGIGEVETLNIVPRPGKPIRPR